MRVDAAGLVRLGAANDDPVVATLDDMHEHVGIGLLGGPLAAIALDVGHGSADHQVLSLHLGQPVPEPLVIVGAVGGVDVVGDRVPRVDGIHADAPLEAGAGELAEPALHPVLRNHIVERCRSRGGTG